MRTLLICRSCFCSLMTGEKHADEVCLANLRHLIDERAEFTAKLVAAEELLLQRMAVKA